MRKLTALSGALLVASCGGSNGGGWDGNGSETGAYAPDYNGADARLVGVEGVAWSVTTLTGSDGATPTSTTTNGFTNDAGRFSVGATTTCTTSTDTNGKQTTSCETGALKSPALTICGVSLPNAPAGLSAYQVTPYTPLDFGNANVAYNLASVLLMGNSAYPGDPTKTGIQLSSGLAGPACPSVDWTADPQTFQQAAATWVTQAANEQTTGTYTPQHYWPAADIVNNYVRSKWLCAHSGYYYGQHYGNGGLRGLSHAVITPDGAVDGWLDFSNSTPASSLPGFAWSGNLTLTPGLGGTVAFTTDSSAPVPNLAVNFQADINGGLLSYKSADGTIAGSTASYDQNNNLQYDGMGPPGEPAIIYPKYSFVLKDVSYTEPGQTTPHKYVVSLIIGYGGYVEGKVSLWPPLPYGQTTMYLEWYGQLVGKTVTLHWFQDNITKRVPTSKTMTLTFDDQAITLTGPLVGYDGSDWTTVTIPGCRD